METLHDIALENAPIAIVAVDDDLSIVYWNRYARGLLGGAGAPSGAPSILDRLPPLGSTAVPQETLRAIAENRRVRLEGVELTTRGRRVKLDVVIDPLTAPDVTGAVISAQDVSAREEARSALHDRTSELQETIEELQTTNEELQSANEELETANEELQASNEELATLNEEQQSTNEELESTNEELSAVNAELERRSDEFDRLRILLGALLDMSGDAVILCDRDQTVTDANEVARQFIGDREDELTGRNLFALDLGIPAEEIREALRTARESRLPAERPDAPAVDALGRSRRIHITVMDARDEAGDAMGWIVTWRDLRASLSPGHIRVGRGGSLLGAREGVLAITPEGRLAGASDSARALLGIGPEDALPKNLWDLVDDPAASLQLRGAVSTFGSPNEDEEGRGPTIRVRLHNGVPVDVTFIKLDADNTPPLVILTAKLDDTP